MKITTEHFNLLKGVIENALKADNLTTSMIEEHYKGMSETRKLWDMYWGTMSRPFAKSLVLPIMNQYNDSHIETALRKAWKEISMATV